ncbi:MAG: ABC transporter substrate-binding protein [Chloroflexota bacterium]|nr:ABC transporter substrate-binding protein [Chloroflexota bacterium]
MTVWRALCVLVLCLAIACTPAVVPLRDALPTDALRVGIDASNPPFAFPNDGDDPPYAGFEIDLARALAIRLDVPLIFVGLGFDGLYDALAADRADVVIAALPIDPARLGAVNFSLPYFNAGWVLVSADPTVRRMDDLAGKRLAFEYGAIGHALAIEWTRRIAPFTLLPRANPTDALALVTSAQADAALLDAVSARLIVRDLDWGLSMSVVKDSLFAAATRADRRSVSAAIDQAMQALLSEGVIDALASRWFDEK